MKKNEKECNSLSLETKLDSKHMPLQANSFDYDDLIACGKGSLFDHKAARLPLPPMLMFDKIPKISKEGGNYDQGYVIAEKTISSDNWFFACHFDGDPVMPGCLGLDAMWQLVGFFITWNGIPGQGRALGSGKIKFRGQVLPSAKRIVYEVHIKKFIKSRKGEQVAFASSSMSVDDETIYWADDLSVGVFNLNQGN